MPCYGQGKKPLPKVSSLAVVNVIMTEGKETADQVIVTQQRARIRRGGEQWRIRNTPEGGQGARRRNKLQRRGSKMDLQI